MRRLVAVAWLCLAALTDAAGAQTLDRIAAQKEVRIGFIADQAPFSSGGSDGVPVGYAIDICGVVLQAIDRRVEGVKPSYVETSLADAFSAVASGQIDMLCGAVTATLKRRETVDFSEPIFLTGTAALFGAHAPRDLRELFLGDREISGPRSPELQPYQTLRIGVRLGTTTESALREAVVQGGYRAQIFGFASHGEGLAALESRDIDAYFADRALLAELLRRARDPSRLVIGTRLFTREPYSIAIQRGDSDFRLLIDRALSQFYSRPEFSALLARYFGAEAAGMRAQVLLSSIPE